MKKWSSWILTSILFIFFLTGCTKAAFEPSPYVADDLSAGHFLSGFNGFFREVGV